jgi:hypothetical protein
MINISFPGGAGGNWLISTLNFESIQHNTINFHKHIPNKNYNIKLIHELNPSKFHYLFSGKSYFNFYSNVLYKFFYKDIDIFNNTNYKTYFLECVNTARFICKFDTIYDHVFFNFDDLINSTDKFYNKLIEFQTNNNFDQIEYTDFLCRREQFKKTCINVTNIYENFDNMIWVCFVIGQLMNLEIIPTDFIIFKKENQGKCIKFAIDNYSKCLQTPVHYFDNQICLPKLL